MTALAKIDFNQDIIFILLSISFLLIGILKASYWKHAKLLFMGIFAQRYANQYLREENAFTERVNAITFLLMSLVFSIIILKIFLPYSLIDVGFTIAKVMLFFLFKKYIILGLGSIFMLKSISKLGVFFSFLFDRAAGIILFPLSVFLYFFAFDSNSILLILILGIFIALLILKIFWTWKIGTNAFGLSNFYIFLYLCTLEIFPILLLGKGVFY